MADELESVGQEPTETIVPAEPVASAEPTSDIDAFLDEVESDAPPSPVTEPEGAVAAAATPDSSSGVQPGVAPPVAPVVAPTPPVVIPGAVQAPVAPVMTEAQGQPQAQAQPQLDEFQMRENLVTEISARYAMSEDQKNTFMMEPEKVLPTFAARLYVDVFDAVTRTVMAQLPQLMGQREQIKTVQEASANKFFEAWPGLRDPSLQGDLMQVARTYRAQNPKASLEQSIQMIGTMVSVMKGIPLPGQTAMQPSAAPQGRPPLPAGVGASRAPAQAAPQQNLFDALFGQEDD